ncbi:hypothetical protein GCM10022286_17710 [Gryllotalpicola daejeonensis]|uniref:Uncharacterized protein n=1 Tax=Gryllotalpicola daejeonensis TaxID=993087 RepID=A0ABP7ZK02_9MICO
MRRRAARSSEVFPISPSVLSLSRWLGPIATFDCLCQSARGAAVASHMCAGTTRLVKMLQR